MKKYIHILGLFVALALILSGCSDNDQTNVGNENSGKRETQEKESKNNVNNKKLQPLPSTYADLAKKPIGEHSDFHFLLNKEGTKKVMDTFKDLPDVSNNPSKKDLDLFYQELLAKVQREYKGPEEAIRQLRFQALGDPQMEDSRYKFKENLNVEIILDASGSMAQKINGRSKMDAAKASILDFVKQLPESANVGIRVYGHKGSNADSTKNLSCSSSELLYPISKFDDVQFQAELNKINPTGWTPIGLALNEARKDLAKFDGAQNTNIIYLVSDGISTCDDDPITAAENLYKSNISPIVNVIGFDVDSKGQNQLREIATATDGLYTNVADENQLADELAKVNNLAKTWADWKKKGSQSIELKKLNNGLSIFSYIAKEEKKSVDERTIIYLVLSVFWQNDLMSEDSRIYLEKKNNQYHDWIQGEIKKFNDELKALNEEYYSDALKVLEEKYQQNTQ